MLPVFRRFPIGFSIFEMVVALTIMIVLGAALVPTAASYVESERVKSTAKTLDSLNAAIRTFKTDVTRYPGRIKHLSEPVTGNDTTACNGIAPTTVNTIGGASAAKWDEPYFDTRVTAAVGLYLGIGVANDRLTRTSANTTAGFINITIPSVRFQDAKELNDVMDGQGDLNQGNRSNTTGAIQWGIPNAAEQVTVTFGTAVGKTC